MVLHLLSVWNIPFLCFQLWKLSNCGFSLRGVLAKNERGYRLKWKNIRWWLLLILLLSVANISRKLLPKNVASIQLHIRLGSLKSRFNSKQIIKKSHIIAYHCSVYSSISFDALAYGWYFIIFFIFYDLIVTFKNIYSCFW